jgi:hypothetical protein
MTFETYLPPVISKMINIVFSECILRAPGKVKN